MEITRIRTSKAMPASMRMPRSMSLPSVFVRRSGSSLVARWMPEGAQVDESGMPFCHSVTGKHWTTSSAKYVPPDARRGLCWTIAANI